MWRRSRRVWIWTQSEQIWFHNVSCINDEQAYWLSPPAFLITVTLLIYRIKDSLLFLGVLLKTSTRLLTSLGRPCIVPFCWLMTLGRPGWPPVLTAGQQDRGWLSSQLQACTQWTCSGNLCWIEKMMNGDVKIREYFSSFLLFLRELISDAFLEV